MIADLKAYPEMKDSGLPWLGEVPAGWEIRRNGRLFAQRNETGFPDLPILEVSLKTGVRVRSFDASARKQVMTDRAKYKRAAQGDVAYNMMRMWQGAVGVVPVDGLVSPAYVVARPLPETVPDYYAYLFRTDSYMGEVDNYSRGIVKDRNRLYWEQFKQIPTPFPPPDEQASIVRFLGHAGGQIRRYIRAKRRLIELLEEQKQAIVQQAVTRGLDPTAPRKSSSVEWLDDIPEHWEIRRLRSLAHITTGARDTIDRVEDGQYPFFVRSQTVERIDSWSFDGEAVLTAGDGAGVAKVFHYADGKFDYHQRVYKFSDFRDVLGSFFYEYFRTNLKYEALAGNAKSTVDSLRRPMLQNFPVVVPPRREQTEIVGYVRNATASIGETIVRTQREIELLHEYRKRLIADVVAGKLDVRDAAKAAPEEMRLEEEELDETDDGWGDAELDDQTEAV